MFRIHSWPLPRSISTQPSDLIGRCTVHRGRLINITFPVSRRRMRRTTSGLVLFCAFGIEPSLVGEFDVSPSTVIWAEAVAGLDTSPGFGFKPVGSREFVTSKS